MRIRKGILPPKEEFEKLISLHGSYSAVARVMGLCPSTVNRWGKRRGVLSPRCAPQGSQHHRIIKTLINKNGYTFADKINKMHEILGSWLKVAAELEVTMGELRRYRQFLGIVPRSKWRIRKGDLETHEDEELY